MREAEAFRPELEQILAFFPGKRVLNLDDVCRYTGRSYHWCYNHGLKANTTAVQLALALTKLQ